jgi:hypothetical protein
LIAREAHTVFACDGKVDDGPILRFDASTWKDFVSGVKAGEFNARRR